MVSLDLLERIADTLGDGGAGALELFPRRRFGCGAGFGGQVGHRDLLTGVLQQFRQILQALGVAQQGRRAVVGERPVLALANESGAEGTSLGAVVRAELWQNVIQKGLLLS